MIPFRSILVATDFGPSSQRAVKAAADLAITHGAKLTVVHAYSIFVPIYPIAVAPPIESVRDAAQNAMNRVVSELRAHVPSVDGVVRHGDPHTEILSQAEELGADLIVLGTHGYRGISRFLLGSEAEKIIRLSPIPVLTVRTPSAQT